MRGRCMRWRRGREKVAGMSGQERVREEGDCSPKLQRVEEGEAEWTPPDCPWLGSVTLESW